MASLELPLLLAISGKRSNSLLLRRRSIPTPRVESQLDKNHTILLAFSSVYPVNTLHRHHLISLHLRTRLPICAMLIGRTIVVPWVG